jgi:F0F1-type ATP synthase alpha subunit
VKDYKIEFSSRSGKRHVVDSLHFDRRSAREQKAVSQRLEQLEATRVKDPEFEAAWQDQFLKFMREQRAEVRNKLAKDKKLSKELEADLRKAVEAFQPQFKA